MKITYSGEDEGLRNASGSSSSDNSLKIVASFVILAVVGVAGYFGYKIISSDNPKEEAIIPEQVVTEHFTDKPFSAEVGLEHCLSQYPDINSSTDKEKRQSCYVAVMIMFDSTVICDSSSLDKMSRRLCLDAKNDFEYFFDESNGNNLNQDDLNIIDSAVDGSVGFVEQSGDENDNDLTDTTEQPTTDTSGSDSTDQEDQTDGEAGDGEGSTGDGDGVEEGPVNNDDDVILPDYCSDDGGEVQLLQHTNICNN